MVSSFHKKARRVCNTPAGRGFEWVRYFFLSFEEGLLVLEGEALDGVVFLAEAGLEARCLLDADGFAFSAAVFFTAAVFNAADLTALVRGSVFRLAEADGNSSGSAAGMDACCLAASRQLGKNNSIRWREMELARRQRGQCAS